MMSNPEQPPVFDPSRHVQPPASPGPVDDTPARPVMEVVKAGITFGVFAGIALVVGGWVSASIGVLLVLVPAAIYRDNSRRTIGVVTGVVVAGMLYMPLDGMARITGLIREAETESGKQAGAGKASGAGQSGTGKSGTGQSGGLLVRKGSTPSQRKGSPKPVKLGPRKTLDLIAGRTQAVGSAVAVSPDGHVLTCGHVVQGAKHIRIESRTRNKAFKHDVKVVAVDKANDLALLKADVKGMACLPIAQPASGPGASGYVCGWEIMYEPHAAAPAEFIRKSVMYKLDTGVSALNPGGKRQLTVPLNIGMSGGAVLAGNGDILALVNMKSTGKGLKPATAIDSRIVQKFLKSHGVKYAPGGAPLKLDHDQLYWRAHPTVFSVVVTPEKDVSGKAKIWPAPVPYITRTVDIPIGSPVDMDWSKDGKLAAVAGKDKLMVFDMVAGKRKYSLEGHKGIYTVEFSPDAKMLTSVDSMDRSVSLWRMDTGQLWNRIADAGAVDAQFSSDGKIFMCQQVEAVTRWRKGKKVPASVSIKVFDASSGKLVSRIEPPKHGLTGVIQACEFLPDSGMIASAGRYANTTTGKIEYIHVWNPRTGALVKRVALDPQPKGLHGKQVSRMKSRKDTGSMSFSPDGKYVAICVMLPGYNNRTVWVYNFQSGKFMRDLTRSGTEVKYGPDGRFLGVVGWHGGAGVTAWHMIDPTTGSTVWTMCNEGFDSVNFAPDGKTFLECSTRKAIRSSWRPQLRIWDISCLGRGVRD